MALPRAARAPGCARTHLWAQSSHSVPGLLLKSISALLQLPTAALCPCGRALQAALAAGSRTLKSDIVLLGVQVLFLFAFFSARGCLGFRCVIASHSKQEDQRRDGLWLALAEAFAAGLPNPAGILEEEIIIRALLPQICLLLR